MKAETKKDNRKVDGSIGVSKEAAAEFSEIARLTGYRVSFAAEQALAAWVAKHTKGNLK